MSELDERLQKAATEIDRLTGDQKRQAENLEGEIERLGKEANDLKYELVQVQAENHAKAERIEAMESGLLRIKSWTESYPLSIFPEPDLIKAHKLLEAGGMTLDSISADAMRHVITQVKGIVEQALKP